MNSEPSVPPSMPSMRTVNAAADERVRVVPVLEEQLEIDAAVHDTGAVRIRKVVRHESVAVDAPAYQEQVQVERVAINRPVQEAEPPRQDGEVLVIPVYEERWVRQLVLVEEIRVAKRRHEAQQPNAIESVELRREEVIVERLDAASGRWMPEAVDRADAPASLD